MMLGGCTSPTADESDPGVPVLTGTITIQNGGSDVTTATTGDTLTAVYSGGENVSYQWNKDGNAITTGGTGQTYTPAEAGSYTVTVSAYDYQNKTSNAVIVTGDTLSVLSGTITIQQRGIAVTTAYTDEELSASYSGDENVSYQWNKDGNAITTGGTGQTYTPAEAGSYTVTVSAYGCQNKTSGHVTVNALKVLAGTITIQQGGIAVTTAYTDEELSASYSGGENVSYQWNKDGNAITTGGTGQTYTPVETGSYTVTVSAYGWQSITSAAVTVSVAPPVEQTITSKEEWETAIGAIKSGRSYIFTINSDITDLQGMTALSDNPFRNKNNINITLKGAGSLALNTYTGNLFYLEGSQTTLIIDGPTLKGRASSASLVYLGAGASLELKNGAITDNSAYFDSFRQSPGKVTAGEANGGGVYVGKDGTFTMSGGKITGNTATVEYGNAHGGGVYVQKGGTFTMTDGEISGNRAFGDSETFNSSTYRGSGYGGGVYVQNGGTFIMAGGTIKGNTVPYNMYGNGGGVYAYTGTFTKTGGTITGNDAANETDRNLVIRRSGATMAHNGHAVYCSSSNYRDTTLGEDDDISTETLP